jgi:hypothetical protein
MPAFRLIPTGDLALSGDFGDPFGMHAGGATVLVEGIQQIRQRLAARFQFFAGEWFLDLRQGIPMYRDVLIKKPRGPVVRSLLRRVVLTTPGVLSCPRFDLTFDSKTRRAAALFEAICDGGTIIVKPGDNDFLLDNLPIAA